MSLKDLLNLGPTTIQWLNDIGITTRAELEAVGPVEAFQLISARQASAGLNLLYALEGALRDVRWDELDMATKARLRRDAGYLN